MRFQIVTFATPPYERLAERLRESCAALGLPIKVYQRPDCGDWIANCAQKPLVIREALEEFRQPVVFLDADAIVRTYPHLFDEITEDFAAHFRDWGPCGTELLSGTLYFNSGVQTKDLVAAWCARQSECVEWDQRVLSSVLDEALVTVYRLPASYTQIFDTMAGDWDPVIEHFQEGRKYRE